MQLAPFADDLSRMCAAAMQGGFGAGRGGQRLTARRFLIATGACAFKAPSCDIRFNLATSIITDVSGHIEIGPTQTTRSRRVVPLTAIAIDALKRRRNIGEKKAHGSCWSSPGRVANRGGPVSSASST